MPAQPPPPAHLLAVHHRTHVALRILMPQRAPPRCCLRQRGLQKVLRRVLVTRQHVGNPDQRRRTACHEVTETRLGLVVHITSRSLHLYRRPEGAEPIRADGPSFGPVRTVPLPTQDVFLRELRGSPPAVDQEGSDGRAVAWRERYGAVVQD